MEIKHEAKITLFIVVSILCLSFLALAKGRGVSPNPAPKPSPECSVELLGANEEAQLKFVRVGEEMARDECPVPGSIPGC